MKRKIFISINIPSKVKKRLISVTEKWQDLPVKWVKDINLHITLFFLGYIDNEAIPEICQKVKEAVENQEPFDMELDTIEFFPSENEPRMIAITGPANEELRMLHENIEKELGMFQASRKSFRPHITLGRMRKHKWESLEQKPEISEKLSMTIPVETVDVMASDFGGGESEYTIIESCPLG